MSKARTDFDFWASDLKIAMQIMHIMWKVYTEFKVSATSNSWVIIADWQTRHEYADLVTLIF